MFETLQLAAAIATLVTFVVSCLLFLKERPFGREVRLIELTPEHERAPLVEAALEKFRIQRQELSPDQQFDLLRDQLRERRRRNYGFLVVFVLCFGMAAATYVWGPRDSSSTSTEEVPGDAQTSDPASPSVEKAASQAPDAASEDPTPPEKRIPAGLERTKRRGDHKLEVDEVKAGDRAKIRIGNSASGETPDVGVGSVKAGDDSEVNIGNHGTEQ